MSDESIVKHVAPHSLVMTTSMCDYCGEPDRYTPSIIHLFGIKTCEVHRKWGVRDCEVYMHSHKMVRMIDALKNPTLKRFFAYLEGTFPIRRTNGNIDTDWYIQCSLDDTFAAGDVCMNNIKGLDGVDQWCIPCKNEIYVKQIPICEFLKDDICSKMNFPIPDDLIQEVIDLLTKGIYYDSVKEINEKELNIEEAQASKHPNVRDVFHGPSGKVIRCFIPERSAGISEPDVADKDPMPHS